MDVLNQLHDIDGIDSISWWPLAIGWWVLIGLGLIMGALIIYMIIAKIAFARSWKNDALQQLSMMEKSLSETTVRETTVTLSQLLRRIALKRFPRKECASLIGDNWLKWLTAHDPKQFDWSTRGVFFVDVLYSPSGTLLPVHEVKELIEAVKNWVR